MNTDKFIEALITFLVAVAMITCLVACMKATSDDIKAFFAVMMVFSGIYLLSRMKEWDE